MMHGNWGAYLRHDESQPNPKIDRKLLRRVLAYATGYKVELAVVLVTIVVITLLSLLPPLLIAGLIDVAIPDQNLQLVTWLGLGMVAVPLINGVVGVAQRWASATMGEGIIYDLRRQLFGHLQGMSLGFFTNTKTGELMSRLNSDVIGAQQAVTSTFVGLASNVFTVVATVVIMLRIEWRLTILALLMVPLFVFASRKVGGRLRVIRRDQMQSNASMNSVMQETLSVSGALLVKLFGRETHEDERFSQYAGEVRTLGIRQATIGRWFFMALGVVSALGTAIVFWLGAYLVIDGQLDLGLMVALSAYLGSLYGPLGALANARVEFTTSLVSFERVFEVLDMPVDIAEVENPVVIDKPTGLFRFDDVWFTYDESLDSGLESVQRYGRGEDGQVDEVQKRSKAGWALEGISFGAQQGQTIALVGPSGAGKTTLTYLLPRLYDVSRGTVTIDNVDVRNLSFETVAAAVGVVTQETYLFHDTLEANLRYAKPDATDAELKEAAQAANILPFIDSLADGMKTRVGERGYRLSGGEKQRVAIARVILKNPSILILDEATSHLDARSEALVQEALETVMHKRTSLVIAHRLSTVVSADRIIVLDAGTIVEQGTHEELLAADGLYTHLFRTQFREAESDVS